MCVPDIIKDFKLTKFPISAGIESIKPPCRFKNSKLLNNYQDNFLSFLNENQNFSLDIDQIEKSDLPEEISTITVSSLS